MNTLQHVPPPTRGVPHRGHYPSWGFHASSCLVYSLSCVIVAICSESLLDWDSIHYHFYIAHALLNDRLPGEFFAAGPQTYLNPLAHLPYYFFYASTKTGLGLLAGVALVQSLNLWILHFISCTLIPPVDRDRRFLIVFGVLIGALSPGFVFEVGRSHADIIVSVAALGSLFMLLQWNLITSQGRSALGVVTLAGVFAGFAVGMKPTALIFIIAIFLAMALTTSSRLIRAGLAAAVGFMGAVLLCGGAHAWMLFKSFGSPVFPLFNGLFRSPWFLPEDFVSIRFIPSSFLDGLLLPARMLDGESFVISEVISVDMRPIWLLMAGVALALLQIGKVKAGGQGATASPRHASFIAILLVAAYAGWVSTSGNMRYGLEMFILVGPALAMVAHALMAYRRILGLLSLAIPLVAQSVLAISVNAPFSGIPSLSQLLGKRLHFEVPPELVDEPAYFLSLQSQSYASLAMVMSPDTRFTNLRFVSPDRSSVAFRELTRRIGMQRQSGRVIRTLYQPQVERSTSLEALISESIAAQNAILSEYGLHVGPEHCRAITYFDGSSERSKIPLITNTIVSCPVLDGALLTDADVQARIDMDRRMDRWVEKCPGIFAPHGTWSDQLPKVRRRTFANSDYTLAVVEDGRLFVVPLSPQETSLVLEDSSGRPQIESCLSIGG